MRQRHLVTPANKTTEKGDPGNASDSGSGVVRRKDAPRGVGLCGGSRRENELDSALTPAALEPVLPHSKAVSPTCG